MKRKTALLALSLCFIGMTSGCGENGENAVTDTTTTAETSTATETTPQTTETTVTETEPQTAETTAITEATLQTPETTTVTENTTQTESDTAVSETVGELAETEEIPVEVLFADKDIYLYSFWCDYLSQDKKPPDGRILLIENDEQLAFAEDRYGLAIPEELRNRYGMENNVSVADAFQNMKAYYPPR